MYIDMMSFVIGAVVWEVTSVYLKRAMIRFKYGIKEGIEEGKRIAEERKNRKEQNRQEA